MAGGFFTRASHLETYLKKALDNQLLSLPTKPRMLLRLCKQTFPEQSLCSTSKSKVVYSSFLLSQRCSKFLFLESQFLVRQAVTAVTI